MRKLLIIGLLCACGKPDPLLEVKFLKPKAKAHAYRIPRDYLTLKLTRL